MSDQAWPDLRLAGFAVGVWLAALAGLYASVVGGLVLAAGAAFVAGIVLIWRFPAARWPPAVGRFLDVTGVRWLPVAGGRWMILVVLIGAVCGAAATAARVAGREEQPIAGLARAHARVTMHLKLAGDPHPVGGAHIGPPTYAIDAAASRLLDATHHTTLSVSVLVLASDPGWVGLLPGQQVVVDGRLSPSDGGDLDAAVLSVSSAPELVGGPPWTQRAAGSLRAGLRRACDGLPAQVRGLLPGLIDGDTAHLDPAVSDAFRTTGMTHLVAVSGSNVAMILGAILLAARWCRAGPVTSAVLCGIGLIGFVILVRPSPSVLRAAAMGGLGLVALATGRSRAAVPMLAAVIAGLILYDPALATDVGFALSVFATGGLLLIAPHWRAALRRRRVPGAVADAIAVPAAAQFACSPLIAGISGVVSLIAVPANLLAEPAVPLTTVIGVGAAVLSPIWPAGAAFLAWLASWPARWLLLVAQRGAAVPAAVTAWPAGTWGALLLAVLMIGSLIVLRNRTARLVAVVSIVAAFLGAAPVRLVTGGWPPPGALLVMCDVGQGDGMVLPVGEGSAVVLDAGPEPTAIDGCLRRLGIRDVPMLILSHFHADHVGGVAGVLDGRRVHEIVTSPFDQPPEGYRDVVSAAAAHRIPMSTPTPGEVYVIGSLRLTVLGPVSRLTGTRSDPNDNSLVIRADEDGVRILLTGDAEVDEQAAILGTDGPAALRSDVLKMPHHGSAYQDVEFLAAARPSIVFVSVGAVNPYGLPSVPVLDRLAATSGARIVRTDLDGDLAVLRVGTGVAVAVRGQAPGSRPP